MADHPFVGSEKSGAPSGAGATQDALLETRLHEATGSKLSLTLRQQARDAEGEPPGWSKGVDAPARDFPTLPPVAQMAAVRERVPPANRGPEDEVPSAAGTIRLPEDLKNTDSSSTQSAGNKANGDRLPPGILLIEDSPGDARLVLEMLREGWLSEFEFQHVERVADAGTYLTDPRYECVVLDLSLPDADGLQALTLLRAIAPDVPIVVFTGQDDEDLALDAVQHGAQDYLVKGRIDSHLLRRSIRYAVERKRLENELAHLALHDALTGLPNRKLFLDRLGQALVRSDRTRRMVAVLFFDLDRFKEINDSLGHAAGDQVLVTTANRIQSAIRPTDILARFGGDEFTILCEDVTSDLDAIHIAARVEEAMVSPPVLGDQEVTLSLSIGVSLSQGSNTQPEAMLRNADAAMYRAKERGRAGVELFDESIGARLRERLQTESSLRQAVDRGEFRVLYQPQINLETDEIVGLEALVRWEHPERGLLLPSEFLSVAEDAGLVVPIGAGVMREACGQAVRWRQDRRERLEILVNLSARQLVQPDFTDTVANVIRETDIEPSTLCLEITENDLVDDTESIKTTLQSLKDLGVRLSIDDFGTGYSSLTYLKRFPVDLLKIDRSFVGGLGRDKDDTAIVAAVINLAETLGLAVSAEGVETSEQLSELRALGCGFAQGFYFARPQPAEDVSVLLRS
ncbi:MAG TPA: EAL domain-containing protein [Actinomycetota bacterium]|nr:EAL domain-containing protein [Actinomycetota bacterium]